MKKILALLLVAGMFVFAACGGNKEKEEEVTDSTQVEAVVEEGIVEEAIVDTTIVAEAVVEEEIVK